jgi:hypothetical protein
MKVVNTTISLTWQMHHFQGISFACHACLPKLYIFSKQSRSYHLRNDKTACVHLLAWQAQLPSLYKAYMEHKYSCGAQEVPEAPKFFYIAVLGIEGMCSILLQCYCLISLTLSKGYNDAHAVPQNEQHSYVNETLIHHGLLGTTPVQPVLAISLQTLELYRQCRLRCPQFSIQQWVKVLCDLANVSCSI